MSAALDPDPDAAYKARAEAEAEYENAVSVLDMAITVVDTTQLAWIAGTELEELGASLDRLRELRRRLSGLEGVLESNLARRMTANRMEVGAWLLERHSDGKWVWTEERALLRRIVDDALAEVGGELSMELIWTVLDRLDQARATAYWRTGKKGLLALGIDPKDYGKREHGRRTVQVRRIQPGEPEGGDDADE